MFFHLHTDFSDDDDDEYDDDEDNDNDHEYNDEDDGVHPMRDILHLVFVFKMHLLQIDKLKDHLFQR